MNTEPREWSPFGSPKLTKSSSKPCKLFSSDEETLPAKPLSVATAKTKNLFGDDSEEDDLFTSPNIPIKKSKLFDEFELISTEAENLPNEQTQLFPIESWLLENLHRDYFPNVF